MGFFSESFFDIYNNMCYRGTGRGHCTGTTDSWPQPDSHSQGGGEEHHQRRHEGGCVKGGGGDGEREGVCGGGGRQSTCTLLRQNMA